MQFYKMLATGNEPGDCLRTAIACLLDLAPIAVPHFLEDDTKSGADLWKHVDKWLSTQGLTTWFFAYPGEIPLDDVLTSVGAMNPDKYYIVGGHGYLNDHVVIACNDSVVHDPARLGSGLSGPSENGFWMIMTLAGDKVRKLP